MYLQMTHCSKVLFIIHTCAFQLFKAQLHLFFIYFVELECSIMRLHLKKIKFWILEHLIFQVFISEMSIYNTQLFSKCFTKSIYTPSLIKYSPFSNLPIFGVVRLFILVLLMSVKWNSCFSAHLCYYWRWAFSRTLLVILASPVKYSCIFAPFSTGQTLPAQECFM